jgi:KDO2-lipid IV(A) lauroyltransferase
MWSNYGKTFVEYIFLKKLRNESFHVNVENEQILNDVISNNKPVIFISGHFANFELMSMEITKRKIQLATIYRPLNNFFLNKFMEYLRKKYVCRNQIKKGRAGVKDTLEFINTGHSIALMIDQRVSEGERIKFFNEDALTTTLPAQLSVKYNIDILPIFIERKNNDSFNIKIFKPIQPKKFHSKIEITNKLNEVLEKMIITRPDQWIWTHDRWK